MISKTQGIISTFHLLPIPLAFLTILAGSRAFFKPGWEGIGGSENATFLLMMFFLLSSLLILSKEIKTKSKFLIIVLAPCIGLTIAVRKNLFGLVGSIFILVLIFTLSHIFNRALGVKLRLLGSFTVGFILLTNLTLLLFLLKFPRSLMQTLFVSLAVYGFAVFAFFLYRSKAKFLSWSSQAFTRANYEYLLVINVFSGLFGVTLAFASIPDAGVDSLWQKSNMPYTWSESLNLLPDTNHPTTGLLGANSIVQVVPHLFGVRSSGSFFQGLALFIIIVSILELLFKKGIDEGNKGFALAGASLLLVPAFFWQISMAYDEIVVSCVALGFCQIAWSWVNEKINSSPFWFTVGIALASTFLAKLYVAPLTLILLLALIKDSNIRIRKYKKQFLLLFSGIMFSLPLFFYRWVFIGNPIYPIANSVFDPSLSSVHLSYPYGGSDISESLLIPINTLWSAGSRDEQTMPGNYAGGILIIFILMFIIYRLGYRFLAFGLIAYYIFWLLNFSYMRYLIPLYFVVLYVSILLLSETIKDFYQEFSFRVQSKRSRRSQLKLPRLKYFFMTISIMMIPVTISTYWQVPNRFPTSYFFSDQSSWDWYKEGRSNFQLAEWMNKNLPIGASFTDYTKGNMYMWLLFRRDLKISFDWEVAQGVVPRGRYSVILIQDESTLREKFGTGLLYQKVHEMGDYVLFKSRS